MFWLTLQGERRRRRRTENADAGSGCSRRRRRRRRGSAQGGPQSRAGQTEKGGQPPAASRHQQREQLLGRSNNPHLALLRRLTHSVVLRGAVFEFKVEILVFIIISRSPSLTLAGSQGILVILPIATQFACHVLANPAAAVGHMNFRDKT